MYIYTYITYITYTTYTIGDTTHTIGDTIYDTRTTYTDDITYGEETHTTGDTISDFISGGDGFEPIKFGIHHVDQITSQNFFKKELCKDSDAVAPASAAIC